MRLVAEGLTPEGQVYRTRLAEAGVELTPAQFAGVLVEAFEQMARENPSGFCAVADFVLAVEAAIEGRRGR